MKKKVEKLKAFTLIELIIVMAIIGVLTGLGYGAFTYVKRMARNTQRRNALKELSAFIEDYKSNCSSTGSWTITITCATVDIKKGSCDKKSYTFSKMPDMSTCKMYTNCSDQTIDSKTLRMCYSTTSAYPIGVYLEGSKTPEKLSL
jgi:prepilin-type N-terminal cleavage/methylation domain-containing protein